MALIIFVKVSNNSAKCITVSDGAVVVKERKKVKNTTLKLRSLKSTTERSELDGDGGERKTGTGE